MNHIFVRVLACVALLYWLFPTGVLAADVRVAVLYPEVSRPYATVFQNIIDGVESQPGVAAHGYTINGSFDRAAFEAWLKDKRMEALIVLGSRGVEVAKHRDFGIPVFVGAVLYVDEPGMRSAPGISLTPDPLLLFEKLKRLAPRTKRVFVAYNPLRYSWLMDHAKAAASKLKLKLIAQPVTELRESARVHREFLAQSDPETDALWLLQDASTVGDSSVLPYVLKEAWHKKILVFSSNPGHVKRGALFSLFADREALGRSIGKLVRDTIRAKKAQAGLSPLKDVRIAVNLRTAGHIEITIPYEQQRQFDLVFPKR